jgi:hypothetical protein
MTSRRLSRHPSTTFLDDLVDELLDELLEQRNGGAPHHQARIDSCDLGPLCW